MKFDTTKPVESNDLAADISDDEEIEVLNTQLDQLNNALDSLEQKNDNIKERLMELLQIVKVNRDHLEEVESNLRSDSNTATNNIELSNLREQLNMMEAGMEACMNNVMAPHSSDNMLSLREQLSQIELNVAQAADSSTERMSNSESDANQN
uniref:Uncharacterized protein n=2 Tax=Cacopsylla melanoneura TaxID=428564 RepID=A0A8D8RBA4_9HEMI